MPAALCACLAWLLLCWQATAAAPGLGQPPQRRPHPHHRMPQDQARTAAQREVPARRQPRTRSVSATAPDLGVEDFLGSCGFTVADLPKAGVKWHMASSACSILGKLDGFVFVGDSVTRQVRLPARLGHCHATRKRQGQRSVATGSSVSRSVLAEPFGCRLSAAVVTLGQCAQLYEALVQLLLGDLPRGALRPDAPGDIFGRCECNEQGNRDCRIYTEAWPLSLTWLDGAPLVSRELAPCPNAPDFRLQMFHTYWDWTHEVNARDTMTLARPARVRPPQPPPGMHAWRRGQRRA